MVKLAKQVMLCLMAVLIVWSFGILRDRRLLNEQLIRLHVVAASDAPGDQAVKLQVRDAVIAELQNGLEGIADVEAAKIYLQENLPRIRTAANAALKKAGVTDTATVSLCRERFGTRVYDTFSLPSGVYSSLRIIIGAGEGQNWWCVSFPSLCTPDTVEGFAQTAAAAGFSNTLCGTLTGEDRCEVRFFLLDQLGRLENIFFKG